MPTIDQLQELLRQEPGDAFLNYSLALTLTDQSRFDEALQAFDRALAADPAMGAGLYHRGRCLVLAGRLDEARAALERGIQIARKAGDAHAASEMEGLLDTF